MDRDEQIQEIIEKSKEVEVNEKNLVDFIIRYESEGLPDHELVAFFQHLINTGQAWSLQGHYGRTATSLIEAGICTRV